MEADDDAGLLCGSPYLPVTRTAVDCPPVVLLMFNRPDLTAEVFEAIRAARPRQLLIVADGPRPSRPTDEPLCAAAREVVADIDWPCDVLRKYADENLGCGPNVSQGIDWVFSNVEEALILEDDCVPDLTLYPFCAELLDRYRDDARVMHIAGTNYRAPRAAYLGYSYGFNSIGPITGWATWRRAWREYDYLMPTWPEFRDTGMMRGLPGGRWRSILRREWDRAHRGEATWDHQWHYTVMSRHGLAVSPAVNLVTNIGFRADATQTPLAGDLANEPRHPMEFPLSHPPFTAESPHIERHMERTFIINFGREVQFFRKIVPSHRLRRFMKRSGQAALRQVRSVLRRAPA